MWNSADRDGIQKKLAQHFGISITLVYRIRKKLNLPDLHDAKNHPGKRLLFKRITYLYLTKERSSVQIAKILNMCCENVRNILKQMNIEIRPSHCTNPAYFQTKSSITPHKLLQKIKKLYVDERLPASHIAKRLGIDQGTVRTKLKAMKIKIEVRKVVKEQIIIASNFNIKGIYLGTSEPFSVMHISQKTVTHKGRSLNKRKKANCQWCNNLFPQYIDKGPRTQLYCNSKCKNKAKDYRRMLKGKKVSLTRIKTMEEELKKTWNENYKDAIQRILSAVPIINNTTTNKNDNDNYIKNKASQINNHQHCKQTYPITEYPTDEEPC